jgi:putative ABC transport system permease protein
VLNLPLPIKAILREWRSGELTLLFLALVIAITCVSAMNNFTGMVRNKMAQSASTILGADALITSPAAIDPQWIQKADSLGLAQTTTLSFLSMVEYQNRLQLANIKAIASPYPLRGELKIAKQADDAEGANQSQAPESGTVWIDPRLLPILSAELGQTINIGDGNFKISGIIRDEPGQTGNWFTLSPRIIMNLKDVPETKVIQPGSRITYTWLFNGSQTQLNELQQFMKSRLSEQQKWTDSHQGNDTLESTIQKSLDYLNFGTLMSLVLAGVAISMASLRYCQRHMKQVALLRCFGASQAQVMTLYLSSLALLGLVASLLGALIGYSLQPLLLNWLGGLLPKIDQQWSLSPFFFSIATGMILLFCFSTGNIWQLRKISAIALFRQQHLLWQNSAYLTYGIALLLLALMAYFHTHSFLITLVVLAGCLAFIGLALAGLWLMFNLLVRSKVNIPLNWRFGFNNIARNFEDSALQVIGIGLALTAMLSLVLLKNHLIEDWQQQLPEHTPNYFVINMTPEQVPVLQDILQKEHIKTTEFYPMVRGRLIAINSESVNQKFGEKVKQINALQRELNLSWSENLPEGNQITSGVWKVSDPQQNWVSVDQGLADQLQLKLGDTLQFRIEGVESTVQITSFRKINWNTFKPNFFMLFKPGVLDDLPKTMITSFYLPPEKQSVLIDVTKQFPNVTLIDIANTMKKIRGIMNQAANAITFINFFAFLAGLVIVTLAIFSFSSTKVQETRVLKILGMRRKNLLWIRSSEAFLIGIYAGLLATGTAILINVYLAASIMDSQFIIPWSLFIFIPLLTAGMTVFINVLIQRKQYQNRT